MKNRRLPFARLFLILGVWLAGVNVALAHDFPRPPELEPAVDFWRSVFVDYSEHQTILHDKHNTTIIYKVLDFRDEVPLLDETELRMRKRRVEDAEKEVLKGHLLLIAQNPYADNLPPATRLIQEQLRVHGRLNRENAKNAAESLRGQAGLREKSISALMRAGRYLPYMERLFAEAGLPVLLTRIPLVESSFNNQAYSKSGASGVWQFMPATARDYMNYDEVGDERRDPWFSTEAAVKHLRDDYKLLQDWPLAITAYNFGRNGLARGLAEIGGNSLMDLIQRYQSPRWGFAAKNYYAEFLAAIDIEQNAIKYFGPIRRDAPDDFDEVTTQHYVRYDTLKNLSGDDGSRFATLNPSFSTAVQRGELYVPPGKRIRLPVGKAPKFRTAYASLGSGELYSRQRSYYRSHKVQRGDTLSGIAERYRVRLSDLQATNGMGKGGFIRIGQVLKVPPGGGAPSNYVAESRASNNVSVRQTTLKVHVVASGETLASIARRYSVSISSLQKQNGITRPESLRVGTRLTIAGPAKRSYAYHTIKSGQTIDAIARQYGVSIQDLAEANNLKDVHHVQVGQRLKVPGG